MAAILCGGCGDPREGNASSTNKTAGSHRTAPLFAGEKLGLQWQQTPPTEVVPGARVRLLADTRHGFAPNANGVLFTCGEDTAVDETAPYEAEFIIPKTAYGSFAATAMAMDGDQFMAACAPATIMVKTSTRIMELVLQAPEIRIFRVRPEKQLVVNARFDDGITRRLDPEREGLVFDIRDPSIATVDVRGCVRAVAPGTTLLTVSNEVNTVTAKIRVMEH